MLAENDSPDLIKRVVSRFAICRYIYLDDLMRFMTEDEASRTMYLCEGAAESKRISKQCLKNWLVTQLI